MLHYSKSDLVKIIVITVLVFLNIFILVNGLKLDCDECTIKFSNTKMAGVYLDPPILVSEIKANELYEAFDEGQCLIKFDRVQGYYLAS